MLFANFGAAWCYLALSVWCSNTLDAEGSPDYDYCHYYSRPDFLDDIGHNSIMHDFVEELDSSL